MDVILDANVYYQVIHSQGGDFLQTNLFVELMTYLRRTGSRLVIPLLTFYEVVERYRDLLEAAANEARDTWSVLQAVNMTERPRFPEPNINGELRELRKMLRQPSADIKAVLYTDLSGIDIWDVVRRGVKRIRPASDDGEELRDVVLWLIVLDYAKETQHRVAFISDDKAFKTPDLSLHANLQADITRAAVDVVFFHSIRKFIGENALESQAVDEVFLAPFISGEELRGIATEQLLRTRIRNDAVRGAEVNEANLVEAKRYRVADESYYVEAHYAGKATVKCEYQTIFNNILTAQGFTSPFFSSFVSPIVSQESASIFTSTPVNIFNTLSPSLIRRGFGEGAFGEGVYGGNPASHTVEMTYRVSFDIRLSLRITGNARESLEFDGFRATDFSEVTK
jgi:hypothetical protein